MSFLVSRLPERGAKQFDLYVEPWQLLRNGCRGFLAFVRDVEKGVESVDCVPMIKEFYNGFLEEFPGLSPNREIEFDIDMLLGTRPISIPPYRMAPAKHRELKEQLKDLLEKGRSNSSS